MKISTEEVKVRKKKILEMGIQLIRKSGPDAVGIQEIADASGIPKGSFFNYFKSKDQFLLEALESYTLDAISWNESILRESGLGITSLFNLYEKKHKMEKTLFLEEISCFINVLSQYSSSSRLVLRQKLKFSLETIARAILEALPVPKSEELLQKIQFLESSWRGAMLLYRATGDEVYLDQFLTYFPKTILRD